MTQPKASQVSKTCCVNPQRLWNNVKGIVVMVFCYRRCANDTFNTSELSTYPENQPRQNTYLHCKPENKYVNIPVTDQSIQGRFTRVYRRIPMSMSPCCY